MDADDFFSSKCSQALPDDVRFGSHGDSKSTQEKVTQSEVVRLAEGDLKSSQAASEAVKDGDAEKRKLKNAKRRERKKRKRAAEQQKSGENVPNKKRKSEEIPTSDNSDKDKELTTEDFDKDLFAWKKYRLSVPILRALRSLKFTRPTPVQDACLLPATRDRKDVVGAAVTGSGKTLAFGIPIVQRVILEMEQADNPSDLNKLCALILTPSRELAMQVTQHIKAITKFSNIQAITLVGGMSEHKQRRLLSRRPQIVVATPGRFWELFEQGNEHLCDMSSLRFFVLDEADRLAAEGHFKELASIIEAVRNRNQKRNTTVKDAEPSSAEESADSEADQISVSDEEQEDCDSGEEQEEVCDEIEEEEEEKDAVGGDSEDSEMEVDDLAGAVEDEESDDQPIGTEASESLSPPAKVARCQIFLFSATMMLDNAGREGMQWRMKRKGQDHMLVKLLSRLPFEAKPHLVDLTTRHQTAAKLDESQIQCMLEDKDVYLYYFLTRYPGRTLVFVNAISCLRRLASILKILKLPVFSLHASMQQRQRLKSLERFRSQDNAVLVCSDVAARGLDIPSVSHVLHYQLPRSSETYIHRCGRTARAQHVGLSLAFVCPEEQSTYQRLCTSLRRPEGIQPFQIADARLLKGVRARVRVALELDDVLHAHSKATRATGWMKQQAEAMDIEFDEDWFGGNSNKSSHEEKKDSNLIKSLQNQLDSLLSRTLVNDLVSSRSGRGGLVSANPQSLGVVRSKNGMLRVERDDKDGKISARSDFKRSKQRRKRKMKKQV
eukprot:116350_1